MLAGEDELGVRQGESARALSDHVGDARSGLGVARPICLEQILRLLAVVLEVEAGGKLVMALSRHDDLLRARCPLRSGGRNRLCGQIQLDARREHPFPRTGSALARPPTLISLAAPDLDPLRQSGPNRFRDLSLGFADAAVVACAERNGGRVLTLDVRDFGVVARDGTIALLPA